MLRKVRSSQAAAILGLTSVPPGQTTNLQVTDLWMTNPASGTMHTYLHLSRGKHNRGANIVFNH